MSDYHPRRHDKEIVDEVEIARLLREGTFAVLALAKGDEPYIVTLSYGYDAAKECLYFHSAKAGAKLDFIRANPAACATIIEDKGYLPGECEHAYSSLVLRGKLEIVEGLEEKKHGLGVLLNHLEENPEPILKRNISSDSSYDKVIILRLAIASIAGKTYK